MHNNELNQQSCPSPASYFIYLIASARWAIKSELVHLNRNRAIPKSSSNDVNNNDNDDDDDDDDNDSDDDDDGFRKWSSDMKEVYSEKTPL